MAFKMKGFSGFKKNEKQGKKRIYKKISKLEDKAEKLNKDSKVSQENFKPAYEGADVSKKQIRKSKRSQKTIDRISRLEDRATEGTKLGQALRRKFGPNKAKK